MPTWVTVCFIVCICCSLEQDECGAKDDIEWSPENTDVSTLLSFVMLQWLVSLLLALAAFECTAVVARTDDVDGDVDDDDEWHVDDIKAYV